MPQEMLEKLLTEREVAGLLNLKPSAIGRLRRENKLPHVRVGRLIRYPASQLAGWLTEHKVNIIHGETPDE